MQEVTNASRPVVLDQANRPANIRERPPDADTDVAVASVSSAAAPEGRRASNASLVPTTTTRARLSYDFESEDVIIEILNPRTGDVIKRLPPEDAAAEINTLSGSLPGAVYDGTA